MRAPVLIVLTVFLGGIRSGALWADGQPAVHSGTLHLLYTTDISGRYMWAGCGERAKGRPDLSRLIAAIDEQRFAARAQSGHEPIVIASGDMIQPDLMGHFAFASDTPRAEATARLLANAGFDLTTIGLADLAGPLEGLTRYLTLLRQLQASPLPAANLRCKDESDLRCAAQQEKPYRIFSRGPLRIAVLSIVREDLPRRLSPRNRAGLETSPALESARTLIRRLRRDEGAHLVILIADVNTETSAPLPVLEFTRALDVDAPDLVIANTMFEHGRENFIAKIQRGQGPLIVGTDRFGQTLGEVVFRYTLSEGQARIALVTDEQHRSNTFNPDPTTLAEVHALADALCAETNRPLGQAYFPEPMTRGSFTTYLLQILRFRAEGEIALLNESAISATGFPLEGDLTLEKILRAIRHDPSVVTLPLTGRQIKSMLSPYLDGDERLRQIGIARRNGTWLVNGRELVDNSSYRVATTVFVATGGEDLIPAVTDYSPTDDSLRQLAVTYFARATSALGEPVAIDLQQDFPQLGHKWVLSSRANLGVGFSNVAITNGDTGDRYSLPQLRRDQLMSVNANLRLDGAAQMHNHLLEGQLQLQYGRTWTEPQATPGTTLAAESTDLIFGSLMYRLLALRNRYGLARIYVPEPYVEAIINSEFTPSGTYTDARGMQQSYHYADLSGTLGLGFSVMPPLLLKLGFAVRGELFTPAAAQVERRASYGLYAGYNLLRWNILAAPQHPLQLESRLDYFLTQNSDAGQQELMLQSKVFFALNSRLSLSLSHRFFLFDMTGRPTSFANDFTVGLDVLLDYRRQMF